MHVQVDLRDETALAPFFGQAWDIVADPPWWYADQRKERKDGAGPTRGIGACHHYAQLKTPDIAALSIGKLTGPRCHLHMWATAPLLPDAIQVMTSWGFRYCTVEFVWIKCNSRQWEQLSQARFAEDPEILLKRLAFFGPGFYTGSNVEMVLLGRKGKPFRHAKGQKASQLIFAPLDAHSRKPEEMQTRLERMYPRLVGHRFELFGRRDRAGWFVLGNEHISEYDLIEDQKQPPVPIFEMSGSPLTVPAFQLGS